MVTCLLQKPAMKPLYSCYLYVFNTPFKFSIQFKNKDFKGKDFRDNVFSTCFTQTSSDTKEAVTRPYAFGSITTH